MSPQPLPHFALAPSLGGAESLVTQPSTTSHADLTLRGESMHKSAAPQAAEVDPS